MNRAALSRRALADIKNILDFSVERWGAEQAEVYVREINAAIERIFEDPRRGRRCDDVRPGYSKYLVGSYVLFFRSTPTGIQIVRILHQRMDFLRHL